MKHLSLLILSCLLFQCTPKAADSVTINPILTPVPGVGNVAEDNVTVWDNTAPIELNFYYTSIDTTASPDIVTYSVGAIYPEGDKVQIAWSAPGLALSTESKTTWVQTLQKWGISSVLSLSPYLFAQPVPVTALVTFSRDNKTVNRTTTLTPVIHKFNNDLFHVDFGMSKEQVKANELQRLGTNVSPFGWQEHSPNLAGLNSIYIYSNYTFYEFTADKLTSVSTASSDSGVDRYLEALCRKLKTPYSIPVGPLAKDYTWNNGKLKFTLHSKEFALTSGTKQLVCLTYEKN